MPHLRGHGRQRCFEDRRVDAIDHVKERARADGRVDPGHRVVHACPVENFSISPQDEAQEVRDWALRHGHGHALRLCGMRQRRGEKEIRTGPRQGPHLCAVKTGRLIRGQSLLRPVGVACTPDEDADEHALRVGAVLVTDRRHEPDGIAVHVPMRQAGLPQVRAVSSRLQPVTGDDPDRREGLLEERIADLFKAKMGFPTTRWGKQQIAGPCFEGSQLQPAYHPWAMPLGKEIGTTVHIHRIHYGQEEDYAWPAILVAASEPIAIDRKAIMVATAKL